MCRWSRVLSAVGASVPTEYETIVDSRPIAAGGSGMDPYLPAPQVAYNSPSGGQYITPMLQLLTDPVGASGPATLPVAVFGATARQTWGQMVGGGTPAVLQVGSTPILGKSTGWISTNHPDVTSYNCCPADPYHPCTTYGGSYALVPDEQQDFVAACWMQAMGAQPAASPQGTETACAGQWMPDAGITGNNALSECMQEKLDNNDPYAVCCSWAQAWTYCQMHGNNACATLDCDVDGGPTPPPMPSETCNEMRFFLLRDGGYPQPDGGYCQRCGGCTK
jgi:hypothetical protein